MVKAVPVMIMKITVKLSTHFALKQVLLESYFKKTSQDRNEFLVVLNLNYWKEGD